MRNDVYPVYINHRRKSTKPKPAETAISISDFMRWVKGCSSYLVYESDMPGLGDSLYYSITEYVKNLSNTSEGSRTFGFIHHIEIPKKALELLKTGSITFKCPTPNPNATFSRVFTNDYEATGEVNGYTMSLVNGNWLYDAENNTLSNYDKSSQQKVNGILRIRNAFSTVGQFSDGNKISITNILSQITYNNSKLFYMPILPGETFTISSSDVFKSDISSDKLLTIDCFIQNIV